MNFRKLSWLHGAAFSLAFAAVGCGPTPEKLGDACETDGDPCPSGSVCAPGGEDHICQIAPGGACTPGGTDYCQGPTVCGPDNTCSIPLGEACESATPDHCIADAVCTDAKICEIPVGGACDPAGPDHCQGDNVCGQNLDGTGTCGIAEGGACDPANNQCAGGLTCAELTAGGNACYPPVLIKGMVFDSQTKGPVAEAQVMALDDQGASVSDVAITDDKGNYLLAVPVPRQDDGVPAPDVAFTLRASATDYQTFPGGLRTALPILSSEAKSDVDGWNIKSTLTDIALIGVPADQKGLPSISGKVAADDMSAGVLVVAEDTMNHGFSAITDKSGAYTIFNVPAGAYTVRGYAAGLQLTPATADVAMTNLTGIDLARSNDGLGVVSGNLNIVNAPGGSATSVVLVVASTFSDTFVRGEVPRGLRTPLTGPPSVTAAFSIKDVPAGRYKVLAAFENDKLVRDPDPNIAGTQIVEVDMPSPGVDMPLSDSFKITEALSVVSPGADKAEAVTTAPMLTWADDSSEDFYTVVVYNAYGELVWCLSDQMMGCAGSSIPGVSGQPNVSVPYGGPLEPGMYYQFRATSWRASGGMPGPISNTEDLRGVFYVDVMP
ncbi:carboxypeptidase-like regulatory domain-containing protein [Polyangium sp. y55x31]|uniref:carboxypeptidase-like regulatory domain-containing protein n=1 Tax=Polyangium sp. y55x31 TaxID=3042688 RepID=UPI002482FE83|nr:carboxypeptidase-like regulatory domain-containing protein [Polyangium sp. y55x31]MDI1476998.1 carboxypeptidase-like regulatory domain-containing protein [Polyangium sp. y55x31]